MATTTQSKQRPVYSTRHEQLDVAVWPNELERGVIYNVSIKRSYKDGDEWNHTQMNVGEHHVLRVTKLLDWADSEIQELIAANTEFRNSDHPVTSKRVGNLEVSVWQRDTKKGVRYRVSLVRHYQDGDWKKLTVWLQSNDCLATARLLERTFDSIDRLRNSNSSDFVQAAKTEFGADVDSVGDDEPPF
ncbi:MAG: hypothetical protein KDA87_26640 [Planctomycetales bacterium]|nr:hypothetical protein [Planctomycetales bacterium]